MKSKSTPRRSYYDLNQNQSSLDDSVNGAIEWVMEESPLENELVLSKIFQCLNVRSLKTVRQVCRKWNNMAVPVLTKTLADMHLTSELDTRLNTHRSLHSFEEYTNFEEGRQRLGESLRRVVFTRFCMDFETLPDDILDVLEAPWVGNVVSLYVDGLSSEDWNNIMANLLQAMSSLKKLSIDLCDYDRVHHGIGTINQGFRQSAPQQGSRPAWSSNLQSLALDAVLSDTAERWSWSFLRLCPSLKVLQRFIYTLPCELAFRFHFFFGGASPDWLLNIREALYPTNIKKLSMCLYIEISPFPSPIGSIATFMDRFPLEEVRLEIHEEVQLGDLTYILWRLSSKPLRKLTLQLNLAGNEKLNTVPFRNFFRVLNCFRLLEDVRIGLISGAYENIPEEYVPESLNIPGRNIVLPMPNVKKLAVQYCYFHDQPWRIGQDAFRWIIKNAPRFFPNVQTLAVDARSVRDIQTILRQAKLLTRLENLSIYGGDRISGIRDEHLFGKYNATRKNAYKGLLALKGLKTLLFSAPRGASLTKKTASEGYSRMQSLEVLKIDTQAAINMNSTDIQDLGNKLRIFQILHDPEKLSWKGFKWWEF